MIQKFLHKEVQQFFNAQLALCHAGEPHLKKDHLFGPVKQHLGGSKLHNEVDMK